MKSSGTTGRRPRFRFRFGLRTLLLVTTLVAVWLGLEARRTRQQQALVARLEELEGEYARAPRDYVPQVMHRLLNDDQGCFVESVSVSAFIAPIDVDFSRFGRRQLRAKPWLLSVSNFDVDTIYAPEEMEELLRIPAMTEVRKLEVCGTAMTDDLIDELAALGNLKSVTFKQTVVTESAVARLRQLRPDCTIVYSATSNGPELSEGLHHRAFFMTDDLAVFPRALRGNRESIDALMQTIDWDTDTYLKNNPGATRSLLKEARRLWPERTDLGDRKLLDRAAEDFWQVRGRVTEILMLSSAWRKDAFSGELVNFFRQIDRNLMREPLQDALDHGSLERRTVALQVSSGWRDVDLLDAALSNSLEEIRVMAVARLSNIGDERAIASIHRACRDDHPSVREAALRELAVRTGNRFLDTYREAMGDPDANVRWKAINILQYYPDARSVPVLTKALKDEKPMIRCSAATNLGKIADPSAEPALVAATEDEDSFVRGAAEKALAAVKKNVPRTE